MERYVNNVITVTKHLFVHRDVYNEIHLLYKDSSTFLLVSTALREKEDNRAANWVLNNAEQ